MRENLELKQENKYHEGGTMVNWLWPLESNKNKARSLKQVRSTVCLHVSQSQSGLVIIETDYITFQGLLQREITGL